MFERERGKEDTETFTSYIGSDCYLNFLKMIFRIIFMKDIQKLASRLWNLTVKDQFGCFLEIVCTELNISKCSPLSRH